MFYHKSKIIYIKELIFKRDQWLEIFQNLNTGIYIRYIRQYLTNSVIVSLICSFFPFLDIPVFWPFLFLYFISLVIITI